MAIARYRESVARFEELTDHVPVARSLSELSYVLRNPENGDEAADGESHRDNEAAQAARRAVSICRRNNYPIGVAEGLIQLSASLKPFSEEGHQSLVESLALYQWLNIG